MELISVEIFDTDDNFIEVLFDGILREGFYATTEFDYDVEIEEYEDYDLGIKEYKIPANISFWDFKLFNSEEDQISINNRELNQVKQLIEFKLIDLLTDELNNL